MARTAYALASLALAMTAAASCSSDPEEQHVPAVFELCSDGVDGDDDGLVDCDDPDCVAEPACLCGDGVCDEAAGEMTNCPLDCAMGCGDGVCAMNEDHLTCATDCDNPCGNGVCDPGETSATCSQDCEHVVMCGDGIAEADEECDGTSGAPGFVECGGLMPPRGQGSGLMCTPECTIDYAGCGLAICGDAGTQTTGYDGMLTCADVTTNLQWDVFDVAVTAGDCIHVYADNGVGAADLLAYAVDMSGRLFGGADDFSELDDEWACTTPTWFDGAGCPDRSVIAETTGTMRVGIAQWAGGCDPMPSAYHIDVAVNGVDIDLSVGPAQDDTEMFP
jgi:hypothetical protein